jgi:hypothetical protein
MPRNQGQVATDQPVRYMQGVAVPEESVRPEEFFARTRRKTTLEKQESFPGFAGQSNYEIRKSDIVAGFLVKFTGSLVITGASVVTTAFWPYRLARQVRFTANGQSNIINCNGLQLKLREIQSRGDKNDRGISQTIGGVVRTQGTLATASEAWGAGSNSAIAAGTYPVELFWWVPVAEDEVDLSGAIFAATSSTDLTLVIDWESQLNLFTLAGGTATLTGTVQCESIKYSIPLGADGQIVVPDLSLFHSLISTRQSVGIANGDNETRVLGQGAGKTLLRVSYQTLNGTGSLAVPLAMNGTNYGRQAWRYSGNETPDEYVDGQHLREANERQFNSDIGGVWGFGCHDFACENAFRDAVDMGTVSEFRLFTNIQNGVTLTTPAMEYMVETVFQAGAGA